MQIFLKFNSLDGSLIINAIGLMDAVQQQMARTHMADWIIWPYNILAKLSKKQNVSVFFLYI